jgi:alanyl-tRNA synthetase
VEEFKELGFALSRKHSSVAIVLAATIAERPNLGIWVDENSQMKANELIKLLAKHIQGGGGGTPQFATAGGKRSEGLNEAVKLAKQLLLA